MPAGAAGTGIHFSRAPLFCNMGRAIEHREVTGESSEFLVDSIPLGNLLREITRCLW